MAPKSVDSAGLLREQVESASPGVLRAMVKPFAEALMSAAPDDRAHVRRAPGWRYICMACDVSAGL